MIRVCGSGWMPRTRRRVISWGTVLRCRARTSSSSATTSHRIRSGLLSAADSVSTSRARRVCLSRCWCTGTRRHQCACCSTQRVGPGAADRAAQRQSVGTARDAAVIATRRSARTLHILDCSTGAVVETSDFATSSGRRVAPRRDGVSFAACVGGCSRSTLDSTGSLAHARHTVVGRHVHQALPRRARASCLCPDHERRRLAASAHASVQQWLKAA